MRISDWSSDVCSSDLGLAIVAHPHDMLQADDLDAAAGAGRAGQLFDMHAFGGAAAEIVPHVAGNRVDLPLALLGKDPLQVAPRDPVGLQAGPQGAEQAAAAGDRKSGGEGKRVSVRVKLGGARI